MTYTPGWLVNIASIGKGVKKWPKCLNHGWEEGFYYRYGRERRVRGLWGKSKAAMATSWDREERGRLIRARDTSFGRRGNMEKTSGVIKKTCSHRMVVVVVVYFWELEQPGKLGWWGMGLVGLVALAYTRYMAIG